MGLALFRLGRFLGDWAPQPQIVEKSFLFRSVFVVYLGHGIVYRLELFRFFPIS